MLNTYTLDEHVSNIERYICTIKDSTQSIYRMLPFSHVPHLMLIHLVKNAVFWLNIFPSSNGDLSVYSPRYILTAHEVSYSRHAVLEFGLYVQTYEEHFNNMNQRIIGAICLGPIGNCQGGHWFIYLTSGS